MKWGWILPVYEDEISEAGIVKIDPEVQQKMNVKTAKVETKELSARVITNGILQTDETREFIVNTRLDGWIEKLYELYGTACTKRLKIDGYLFTRINFGSTRTIDGSIISENN